MAVKLSAMMIGSDLDVRMRLVHAAKTVNDFGRCDVCNTLREAHERLDNRENSLNILFISYEFPVDEITEFARKARQIESTKDCAFINLLPANSEVDDSLATSLLAGTDGFLIEPYSCDDLVEIALLASRVKKERASARELVATKFLVKDVIRLLDAMYCLHKCDVDISQTLQKFREACALVPGMSEVAQQAYLDMLIEGMERSDEPIDVRRNAYKGKSARARKRVEEMLINKYETSHKEEVIDKRKGVMMNGKYLRLPPMRTKPE